MPTAAQEQQILSTWGSVLPHPAFDYAYSWGSQSGDTSLSGSAALKQIFAAHNAESTAGSSTPTDPPSVLKATDVNGVSANVPLITSGTKDFSGTLAGTVHQSVSSGTDTVSASAKISSETLRFGSGSQEKMQFLGSQHVWAMGGSGSDTVTTGSGNDRIAAGTGTLDATGGQGADTFVFHAHSGLLNIHDFSPQQGDRIVVDKSLQGALTETSDGHGGVMLGFGTSGHGIDVLGQSSVPASSIHFV
jgi:Ca2+-binding RTX toxin-like protein